MDKHVCRACRGSNGWLVLDLGQQPACDYFPQNDDPGPDPVYPLQMWLCSSCGLAQLLADPTVPEEPREPNRRRSSLRPPTRSSGWPQPGCCEKTKWSPSTAVPTADPGSN